MSWLTNILLPYVIRFLSLFLPKAKRSGSTRLRSFIAVGSLLVATAFEIANVATFLFIPPRAEILWANLGLLLVSAACLLTVRLGVETGRVVPFFIGGYTVLLALVSAVCGSFIAPGMYFFIIFVMYGALLSLSYWTIIQSAFAIAATLIVFSQTYKFGLSIPWGWEVDDYLRRMNSVVFILCFCSYFCMAVQDYFKRRALQAIRKEKEWVLRKSRFFELSSLTASLNQNLDLPTKVLEQQVKALIRQGRFASPEELKEIARTVDSVIRVSRSFHLLYDLGTKAPITHTSVRDLFDHLHLVLDTRARELDCTLEFAAEDLDQQIHGPISSLALVLVALAQASFDRSLKSNRTFHVSIGAAPGANPRPVQIEVGWPKSTERRRFFPDLDHEDHSRGSRRIRDDFIRGILEESRAQARDLDDHEFDGVALTGEWFLKVGIPPAEHYYSGSRTTRLPRPK